MEDKITIRNLESSLQSLHPQLKGAANLGDRRKSYGTILLIILILLLVGALPTWPYSSAWATIRPVD